jgi:hypothetical protein
MPRAGRAEQRSAARRPPEHRTTPARLAPAARAVAPLPGAEATQVVSLAGPLAARSAPVRRVRIAQAGNASNVPSMTTA